MNDESAVQGSAAWLYARVGKVTASRFCDVMAKLKNGAPAKARTDYLWEVVIERLTGNPSEHFASAAMQWGSDNEALARMRYEVRTGALVEEVGLIEHPSLAGVAGSPDGLIGDDGGWECKCPFNSAIHLQTVLTGMPDEHKAQIQGLMWITGRAWWDFASFDPRMPAPLDLFVQRIERDEAYIGALEAEVLAFLGAVEALESKLRGMMPTAEPAPASEPMAWPQEHPPELEREEAATLSGIEKAIDSEMAAIVLDMARGQPWHAKAAEAFKVRWVQE